VLNAVTGSPGWFNKLYRHEGLGKWMSKPFEFATHCVPLLATAVSFAGTDVFSLLNQYWLSDTTYDPLSLNVLLDFKEWDLNTVLAAEKLVNRSELWITGMLIERIAEINSQIAPRVLRASLDRKLTAAIDEFESKKADINTAVQKDWQYMPRSLYRNDTLDRLLEDPVDYISVESLAEEEPKSFLQFIWPWFLDVAERVALSEHDFVMQYRSDTITIGRFKKENEETIVTSLFVATKKLAETDLQLFLKFFNDNTSSDLLIVHRILAIGLVHIAANEPQKVLEYLLGDPRRFCIGDHRDNHKDTKRLITDIFSHLSQSDRLRLEYAVLSFNRYKKVVPDWDVEGRRCRMIWTRQDRLRLLRAFPGEYLSLKTRQLRLEEERAFPGLTDYDSGVSGGCIGPRLKADEMAKASDAELLNLFNQLPDDTQWDNPKRRLWENFSRSGGSIQQSREFKEFAKNTPKRAVKMITSLEPSQHEIYAGAGLDGLESSLPFNELISLIENLDKKGFASGYFREGAASALEKLAELQNGLPEGILTLLEKWLREQPEPIWPDKSEPKEEKAKEIKGSILFGASGLFLLPHGRGTILRAITAGYLERQTIDYYNWACLIRRRLGFEQHPDVWALTMMHMPVLFNGNPEDATNMYDAVIQTCPQVLEQQVALFSIARVMPRCHPLKFLQEWLEKIKACSSDFNHQAYGEMLFLYHCYYQDSWSSDCIMSILSDRADKNILLGLAFGVSHLWYELKNRAIAREILCLLASHHDISIQHAVADVFRSNRDHFQFNSDIRKVIQGVSNHPPILLEAATDLVELLLNYTAIEPKLVSDVCQKVIRAGGMDIGNISTSLALLAEPLTSIALTLHRHIEYREVGLQMFEELISLNVRETRAALEMLDRKPMKKFTPLYRRRRRRKKRS